MRSTRGARGNPAIGASPSGLSAAASGESVIAPSATTPKSAMRGARAILAVRRENFLIIVWNISSALSSFPLLMRIETRCKNIFFWSVYSHARWKIASKDSSVPKEFSMFR
jgi:hypothetical protein